MTSRISPCLFLSLSFLLMATPTFAGDATTVGGAAVSGVSAGWIAVAAPFTGDDNKNGWADYEIATDAAGPFGTAAAHWVHIPGPSEWRIGLFARGLLTPATDYYVRVTYIDPDGVLGVNPQIVGPITTPAASVDAVTAGTATAEVRDDEIFVTLPIHDDANANSGGTVEIATHPAGPWVRKCGSASDANLQVHPKRCRLRSLTSGTDYWIRFTLTDPDGVAGTNPQVLGPVRYDGSENLALGKAISADSGWGCCANASELLDGRIQNDAWYFGFAWTGGTTGWAGGAPGFKQATVDLGAPTLFNRAVVWYHDPASVPTIWGFQYSDDGVTWTDAATFNEPICRGAGTELAVSWSIPSCSHDATFAPVVARYLRFAFDDRTLFRGLHGWAVEIEVFHSPPEGDVVFYAADDRGNRDTQVFTVDSATGDDTPLGPLHSLADLETLAFDDATGELFGITAETGELWKIDRATGVLSSVCATDTVRKHREIASSSFHPTTGELWAYQYNRGLVTLDLTDCSLTRPWNHPHAPGLRRKWDAVAWKPDASVLYASQLSDLIAWDPILETAMVVCSNLPDKTEGLEYAPGGRLLGASGSKIYEIAPDACTVTEAYDLHDREDIESLTFE